MRTEKWVREEIKRLEASWGPIVREDGRIEGLKIALSDPGPKPIEPFPRSRAVHPTEDLVYCKLNEVIEAVNEMRAK